MIRLLTCGDPIFSVPLKATPTTTRTATAMSQGGKVYSFFFFFFFFKLINLFIYY